MTISLPQSLTLVSYVGSGSYGDVCRCHSQELGIDVAVKRIQLGESGSIPATALREISVLKHLGKKECTNIVRLIDVQYDSKSLFLLFELCEYDLEKRQIQPNLTPQQLTYQLLCGLKTIHDSECIHRDLKPSNLLIKDNVLKISDFGLARTIAVQGQTTSQVVSLWYRAPELVMGLATYGAEIDCWSAGCCVYYFLKKKHLFEGVQDGNALIEHCCYLFGGYSTGSWGKYAQACSLVKEYQGEGYFDQQCEGIDYGAVQLLRNLICCDKNRRWTVDQALACEWLSSQE